MSGLHRTRRLATTFKVAAGSVVCLLAATAMAPGAAADPFSDGQWYVAPFKLAANHAIANGSGVTVAVLDGVFSPSSPSLAGASVTPPSPSGCVGAGGATAVTAADASGNHATQMVAMIAGQGGTNVPVGVAPGAKVLVYNVGINKGTDASLVCNDASGTSQADQVTADAINDAVAKGARIISMSFGGYGGAAIQTAILFGERKGVVFVASTNDQPGAKGSRLVAPGSYNGVVAVNGIDSSAKLVANSATGSPAGPLVVASAPGKGLTLGGYQPDGPYNATTYVDGSSPATAFVAGVLAVTLSKYPKATGNQLIQSLARNTGGEEHGLDARALDGYGYGVPSLTSMLQHDPTAYPDENPTLRDGADPTTSDITQGSASSSPSDGSSSSGSSAPSSSAPTSAAPTPQAAADTGGSSTGLVIGIVVGAVVIVAIVVAVVLLARRNRRPGPPPPGAGPPVAAGYR